MCDSITDLSADALISRTFPACGLNADFCVSAWHVSGDLLHGTGIYIVDDENDSYSVIHRTYTDDGCHDVALHTSDDVSHVIKHAQRLDETDIDEHNAEVFSEYFKQREQWNCDYVESDDYAGEYGYLMRESDQINRSVRKLLRREFDLTSEQVEEIADTIACRILDDGLYDFDACDEYSSEHVGYLDSFQVGEYEDQIEVDRMREEIGDDVIGDFFDALDSYLETQRDFCLRHWGSTPLRDQKYPTIYLITYTGTRIDYFIDDETLTELVDEYATALQFSELARRVSQQHATEPGRALINATRLWNWSDCQDQPEQFWRKLASVCPWSFENPGELNSIRFTYAS